VGDGTTYTTKRKDAILEGFTSTVPTFDPVFEAKLLELKQEIADMTRLETELAGLIK